MSSLPMEYETRYEWQKEASNGVIRIDQRPDLPVGSPHDLDRYSPEHLLLLATETCTANYVLLLAKMAKIEVLDYRSKAHGELERGEDKIFRFKKIVISAELSVKDTTEAEAQKVLDKAHHLCIIGNSLKCPVEMESQISIR